MSSLAFCFSLTVTLCSLVTVRMGPLAKPEMNRPEFNRPMMGTVFMALGVAMLIYDSFHEWDTIWATAIGLKLIVVAIIFLAWDPLRRLNEAQRRKHEAENAGPQVKPGAER
jgi:hypothetical protein